MESVVSAESGERTGKIGDRIPVEIQRAKLRERGERRSVRHGVVGENERAQLRKSCKKMHVRNIAVRQRERREIPERGNGGAVPGRERLSGKLKAVRRGIDIHSGDGETGGGTGGGGHFWRRCRVRVGFPAGRTLQKQKQRPAPAGQSPRRRVCTVFSVSL